MVCLGNICRSPLAEGILRNLAERQHLPWHVASAGTGNWHVGQAPDIRSIAIARQLGYDISGQRARHFKASFFREYDLILVMDRQNKADVLRLSTNEQEKEKVALFLGDSEVRDPYYDNDLFEPVCREIEARCQLLIAQLEPKAPL